MAQLIINMDRENISVSEMRQELAKMLSKLGGGQLVSFSFTARLPQYIHIPPSLTPPSAVLGLLARPEND